MNKFSIFSCKLVVLFFITFTACTDIESLKDDASIESFSVLAHWPEEIVLGEVVIKGDSVVLPIEYGRNLFPLKIVHSTKFSETTENILDNVFASDTITFNTINDIYRYRLIAESGVPHVGYLVLEDVRNKEIESFVVSEISGAEIMGEAYIDPIGRVDVKLNPNDVNWPVIITPIFVLSEGASIEGIESGTPLEFSSYDDVKLAKVFSSSGELKDWKITLSPNVLPNNSFDKWINISDPKKVNIDPTPGIGKGWATANNNYVVGTRPIKTPMNQGASLITSIQDLSFIGLGKLIASGTLYTGQFRLNLQLDNPKSMTYFGIPFEIRPLGVSLIAKYSPGVQLKKAVKNGRAYELKDIEGIDKGHIWVQLLHWDGGNDLEYHKDPLNGLTVLGEGEYVFTGKESERDWTKVSFDIKYKDAQTKPTHIAIVMTSSIEGDLFVGAPGSSLCVDFIDLIY